jgi:hypothetical protein
MYASFYAYSNMKKNILLLPVFLLFAIVSCNPLKDFSFDSIKELYDGRITVGRGMNVSTSKGKESRLTITMEQATVVTAGLLTSASVSNNCAVLFANENPNAFDKIDVLEVEILASLTFRHEYKKQDLVDMERDHSRIEQTVTGFVGLLNEDRMDDAMKLMKSDAETDTKGVASFLKTVKAAFPGQLQTVRVIGYQQNRNDTRTFEIGFVVISQDNVQRMFKVVVEGDESGLKFSSITI